LDESWKNIRGEFVEAPATSLGMARAIMTSILRARGQEVPDFERPDDPGENASTETMRKALLSYRLMIDDALGEWEREADGLLTATGSAEAPGPAAQARTSLLRQWDSIQVSFVDDPAEAVRSAADLIDRFAGFVFGERVAIIEEPIESAADEDDDEAPMSTEELRLRMCAYREVLRRLLEP